MLLHSYQSCRNQYVQLDDSRSNLENVTCGTSFPQGSILGPLLFNIFINNITKTTSKF